MIRANKIIIGLIRLSMGWLFIWGFLDKTFGLGFPTTAEKAWVTGASPTYAFLKFATYGPLQGLFQQLAGSVAVDWLFMTGLLLVGLALILGIGVRIAGISGAIMVLLMWLSLLPPADNPFMNQHLIYLLVCIWLGIIPSGEYVGFGAYWGRLSLVRKYPWLK